MRRVTPFPPEGASTEAMNGPNPGPSASEGVQAVRDDLSASPSECWRTGRSWGRTIVRQNGPTPDKETDELIGVMNTRELARQVVDAVNGLRVVDDEETVERVARMIHDHSCDGAEQGTCGQFEQHRKWYISDARFAVLAAVQALRDGRSQ